MSKFIKLELSGGWELPIFIDSASVEPKWVSVLFAGNGGAVGLTPDGPTNMKNNFLMRTRDRWVSGGNAYVIVDAPVHQEGKVVDRSLRHIRVDGMPDKFRLDKQHSDDMRVVVSNLRDHFPLARVAFIGTSRGVVSIGGVLCNDPELADAYVLTSPVTVGNGNGKPGLEGLQFGVSTKPVLVVANSGDRCKLSPYPKSEELAHTNSWPLLTVHSSGFKPGTKRCDAMTPHGFLGIEDEVLKGIYAWLDDPSAVPVAT